ncbi:MAG: hypothetical protein ACRDKU_09090 [Gaiellaceae bacterium]
MTGQSEPNRAAESGPSPTSPPPDESPFETPPLETVGRDDERAVEQEGATNLAEQAGVDPDASPFEAPPIEGIPYERGSEEDRAIRQVIEEADAKRRQKKAGAKGS